MSGTMPVKWRCTCGGCGCGCCQGIEALTPRPTSNRPGLSALSYRVGTHGSFLQTMKARLSSHVLDEMGEGVPTRPLAGLRTRDGGDPAIALLDAWAVVGDVLTFYQERIANEGYLRTATEMRSMFELSRLVGYQPRPGVASSVYLAYTIDANTTQEIVVPQGARSQTVPGQDELPQSFETSQDLKARAAWNRLGLRQTEPQQWRDIARSHVLYLAGTQTRLKVGDPILIDFAIPRLQEESSPLPVPARVIEVRADAQADRTAVRIEEWIPIDVKSVAGSAFGEQLVAIADAAPTGKIAGEIREELNRLNVIAPHDPAFASGAQALRDLVRKRQAQLANRSAPILKPWLAEAADALDGLRDAAVAPALERDIPASLGEPIETSLAEQIRRLIAPPSKPRSNALQLRRSLSTSFTSTSDTALKLLEAVAPALKTSLAAALAGAQDASPAQPIRVWALRLRAGLFGRAFPRRTKTLFGRVFANQVAQPTPVDTGVQTSSTVDDGEWPIVVAANMDTTTKAVRVTAREAVNTLYLDASHDGIAPTSWVFVDSTGVAEAKDDDAMVRPTERGLVAQVQAVFPKVSRADYGGSGDTTALTLGAPWIRFAMESENDFEKLKMQEVIDRDFQIIRRTAVYAQSELLALAEQPIDEPLCGGTSGEGGALETSVPGAQASPEPIELDGLYAGLEPGRFVIVSGERADVDGTRGVFASEPAMITEVVHDVRDANSRLPLTRVSELTGDPFRRPMPGLGQIQPQPLPGDKIHTFIWIDKPLAYCYRRDSVEIFANVVKATHGETRIETLGNGDGARPLQSFDLKHSPLTHLPAATAAGAENTLRVFVNDVRWHEAAGFFGHAPTDHIYRVQTDDKGKTSVQFGNGREGARLHTGIGNVRAVYRNGIGRPGNAAPRQIQQLATRPLGVKEVINPLRASGGADPESRDQVRRNAPLAVKSLDRLVSTADYADFARTFAGIAKADAQEISDGRRSVVHVTVAGIDDIPIDTDSDLMINLRRALRDLGDPFQPLAVEPRELRLLIVSAKLRIEADHLWEPVVTQVRDALLDAFGFERRELAQGVASSELLSVMQSVPGVAYVDLDAFGAIDTVDASRTRPLTPAEAATAVNYVVRKGVAPAVQSYRARRSRDDFTILPGQLALLSSDVAETLVLNQMA